MATPTIRIDRTPTTTASTATTNDKLRYAWAGARLLVAFEFLWAFFDKTLGLGYSTKPENAWIRGGAPTYGFLANTKGWFSGLFQPLAASQTVEVIFMVGLLGVGLALLLGIGMRIATVSGVVMLLLMYLAKIPTTTGFIYDADLLSALVIVGALLAHAGDTLGFGASWARLGLVQKYRFLA